MGSKVLMLKFSMSKKVINFSFEIFIQHRNGSPPSPPYKGTAPNFQNLLLMDTASKHRGTKHVLSKS